MQTLLPIAIQICMILLKITKIVSLSKYIRTYLCITVQRLYKCTKLLAVKSMLITSGGRIGLVEEFFTGCI